MHRSIRLCTLFALLAAALVGGCDSRDEGGGSGDTLDLGAVDATVNPDDPNSPASCELADMRGWVDASMRDYYLFYDQVPSVELDAYTDLQTLLYDLRVSPNDPYSYIADARQSSALFEQGKRFGFGWRLVGHVSTGVYFGLINHGSPMDDAGVQRGDQLMAINGVDVADLTDEQWDSFLGVGDEIVSPALTIRTTDDDIRNVTVTKTLFDLQTVHQTDILQQGTQRIGYLNFLSFLETSRAELDAAFAGFREELVDELVIDLRYNSGGRIAIANQIAANIAGDAVQDGTFVDFRYNDKYSYLNSVLEFEQALNPLDLHRVFVLTSDDTCSASELVINGLRPFIEVILVGDTTCGKPYATRGREQCGQVLNALEVDMQNAVGVGGYYDGIGSDCPLIENVQYPFGDPSETLLAGALSYIQTGSCAIAASATAGLPAPPMPWPDVRRTAGTVPAPASPIDPLFDEARPSRF